MEQSEHRPPRIMLAFFRWFCHPDIREEIEGDLLERFHNYSVQQSRSRAKLFFFNEVVQLFRPSIIGNVHHLTFNLFSDMKKIHWLQLFALNLVVALCIFLPFIPGTYDELSIGLSATAQLVGYLGMLLVPIGVLWLIQEIKKAKSKNVVPNNWNSGYYFAITATIAGCFIALLLSLGLLMSAGVSSAIISLALVAFALYRLLPRIRHLKKSEVKTFNVAPLYLLSIPIIAFTVRFFFIGMLCDYSRNYVIEKGEAVVSAVENYYVQNGHYPESITELHHIPQPSIMGISEFRYERNGSAYNLSFVQSQFIFQAFATEEVVMYNKNDEHNVKGHYASYSSDRPHWKYFWLD